MTQSIAHSKPRNRVRLSRQDKTYYSVVYTLVTLLTLIVLLPLTNVLACSFSAPESVASGKVLLWPVNFSVSGYERVFNTDEIWIGYANTLYYTIVGTFVNVFVTMICAYPLARRGLPYKSFFSFLFAFTMLFSGGLVPTYIIVGKMGLMNTLWALILPGAVPVWNCILLMNFFRSLPDELEEAAIIDGAVPIQILVRIYLPVSLPSLATVMLFCLVGHWNEFFSGLIYMNHSDNYPLATYISTIVDSAKDLNLITDPEEIERIMKVSERNMSSAKIFVSMIPILIIYPFLQRYFVKGIVLGSVKG